MTDPDRDTEEQGRNSIVLWVLLGLMATIAVGGLVYGLAYTSIHASNPPVTVGSSAGEPRAHRPL
jgi:uncharacterized membrane protein